LVLKKISNVKYIWFFDEIFTINRRRVIEFCLKLIKEKIKIKWVCDSRVDLVDLKLLWLMRKAGCIGISYGVESGSQMILDKMNKGITLQTAINALRWTRKCNIPIQLNIILGFLGENKRTIYETVLFIKKTLPDTLQITKMMSLDGTEFQKIAIKNEWIRKDIDWKTILTQPYKKLVNYKPFENKIEEIKRRIKKHLILNPKWWLLFIKTLIFNPVLFKPVIGILINRNTSLDII